MEKLKVKILGISASNRPNMNTAWLVRYALKAAEKVGKRVMDIVNLETEFLDIADKEIKPCLNCEKECMTNEGLPYRGKPRPPIAGCPIKDYMSEVIMPKMKEADGYVYGSPVYTTSFTSKYRLFTERFSPMIWEGILTNKPAAAVTVGELPFGGQESCMRDMNKMIQAGETLPVGWYMGGLSISGPPYGPMPGDKDYNKRIGAKNDKFGKWLALVAGRRVAEITIVMKLGRRKLGDVYTREFTQINHPPRGDEPWGWTKLDKEDEEYMMSL